MPYEDTKVPIERSQMGLQKILKKHGARAFAFGEAEEGDTVYALVRFEHQGMQIRMRVAYKEPDLDRIKARARKTRRGEEAAYDALMEQEGRRIWRVLHWNIKSRMEAVEEGVETFVEAFMAHLINPSTGLTVYEELTGSGRTEFPEPLSQRELTSAQ